MGAERRAEVMKYLKNRFEEGGPRGKGRRGWHRLQFLFKYECRMSAVASKKKVN
jgi:hypothetical protein